MTTYTFETMTQAQADGFSANDVLVFTSVSAAQVGVTVTPATPTAPADRS